MTLFFQIFAGFAFGVFGVYLLKEAKRRGNFIWIPIGIALLAFTYFIWNPWADWIIGIALLTLAYCTR